MTSEFFKLLIFEYVDYNQCKFSCNLKIISDYTEMYSGIPMMNNYASAPQWITFF